MNTASMGINVGNTAFILICASLVMLMTPGLSFFYGGLVVAHGALDHDPELHFAGLDDRAVVRLRLLDVVRTHARRRYRRSDGDAFLRGVTLTTMFTGNNAGIPLIAHIAYQMMFAIITPALITGAFANRVTFKAFHLPDRLVDFRLFPRRAYGLERRWAFRQMGRAGFRRRHCRAYDGGNGGVSLCILCGQPASHRAQAPHVPLIALGTGLLWFGWYGFNAGSELAVDSATASAF